MSDEELDQVAGGGYTPEKIGEVLKNSGNALKDMGKNLEEIMKLFTGGKTSKS